MIEKAPLSVVTYGVRCDSSAGRKNAPFFWMRRPECLGRMVGRVSVGQGCAMKSLIDPKEILDCLIIRYVHFPGTQAFLSLRMRVHGCDERLDAEYCPAIRDRHTGSGSGECPRDRQLELQKER